MYGTESIYNPKPQQTPDQPQAPPATPSTPAHGSAQTKAGGKTLMLLMGIAAIIIIAVAAYYLSSGPSSSFYSLLSLNGVKLAAVSNAIAQEVNTTSELNLSYSGTVSISSPSSTGGSSASYQIPISLVFKKYQGDSRIDSELQGIPLVGNLSVSIISLNKNSKSYVCLNSSLSSAGSACYAGNTTIGSELNLALQPQYLTNVSVNYLSAASYKGNACYLVSGGGTLNSSSQQNLEGALATTSGTATKVNYTACLSQSYYLPLNLSVTLTTPQAIFALNLTEVQISTTTTDREVATLPAPVVNASSLLGVGGIAFSCMSAPNFLCTNIALNVYGGVSLTFGQNTGESMYNIKMACGASSNSSGMLLNSSSIVYIDSSGAATESGSSISGNVLNLTSGTIVSISGLRCYDADGNPLTTFSKPLSVGTPFAGYLWLNYTDSSGFPHYAKVATMDVKAT